MTQSRTTPLVTSRGSVVGKVIRLWVGDRGNVGRLQALARDLPPLQGYRPALDPPGTGDNVAET